MLARQKHAASDKTTHSPAAIGGLLRRWRELRRLSQLDLAGDAEISARHLSFVETGRAQPSREMVLRLCTRLDVPLRERNTLLLAAGYAPMYAERRLDDPALQAALQAVQTVLAAHEPFPALAVDRHWNMVAANRAISPFLEGVAEHLLRPPINVLRLTLSPGGFVTRIVNYGQWRNHILHRLHRQIAAGGDAILVALTQELEAMPAPAGASFSPGTQTRADEIALPLILETPHGMLSFISTLTVFGTPEDITLSELAIETFFPADAHTTEVLRAATPP